MSIKDNFPALFVAIFVLGGGALMINQSMGPSDIVDLENIIIPEFSQVAKRGEIAFSDNCAACHGENASGTDNGPPFLDMVYNPGHHSNDSFLAAVKQGVQQHHWNFGNMPPQPQVSKEKLIDIVTYVRELQDANGIKYQKHMM